MEEGVENGTHEASVGVRVLPLCSNAATAGHPGRVLTKQGCQSRRQESSDSKLQAGPLKVVVDVLCQP